MGPFARNFRGPFDRPLRFAALGVAVCLVACGTASTLRTDEVDVSLVAQRAAWHAAYRLDRPGRAASEIPTGREVHVPVGADVRLELTSLDYICGFALPGFGVRDFAAPGIPSEIRFTARKTGRYDVKSEALCGLPESGRSRGVLVVEDAAAFRDWVERRTRGTAG